MQQVILTVGLSGAGKTYFSINHKKEHPEFEIVCKDDIRLELNQKWSKELEKQVIQIRDDKIREHLNNGKSVIVADTNLAEKHIHQVQKLHVELTNIRQEYVKSVVMSLVRTKPEYIAIEDLNIRGMMKNRCLSKAIQKQNFYYFRLFLEQQCKKRGIELRLINRYYPSSKLCSFCNHKHTELTLRDRIFKCPNCKVEINRDFNAALNIRDCRDYKIYI